MSRLCERLIAKSIDVSCDEITFKGLEPDGLIINRSDIDMAATEFDTQCPNIIKSLVLNSGKKGYDIAQLGNTPFTGTTTSMETGTYKNSWTNNVPIAVLANGPEVAAEIIDKLVNGQFVVILKNKAKGTNGKSEYQVYGFYQGLTASAGENDKYSDETEGGWLITLTESKVPKSALFFYNTDAAATKAAYESLRGGGAGA